MARRGFSIHFLFLVLASLASASLLQERQGEAVAGVHEHEHDNSHAHKQRHYNKHAQAHKQTGKHIHKHEHVHNHQHVHDHGHDAAHSEEHAHTVAGEHRHKHWRLYRFPKNKSELGFKTSKVEKGANKARRRNGGVDEQRRPLDHQVASVNEYIGDSGKELEGAAEQIVESYMGEYMQEYMKGWYKDYCAKTGEFCDQVEMDHGTKDPKTGAELTYEVTLNNEGMEDNVVDEEEEVEDTVFSEEDQRLVRESVRRMHQRLRGKKRQMWPNKEKERNSKTRRGKRQGRGFRRRFGGRAKRRLSHLGKEDQGYRAVNLVLLE